MDGGFAEDFAINYSQFEGYDLIVGAPVNRMSEVKNRLIAWRKSNTDHLSMAQYRFVSSIKCKDEEFELAPNVNGRLLLYFNADKYTLQCTSLQMDIERQKTILEELKKFPRVMQRNSIITLISLLMRTDRFRTKLKLMRYRMIFTSADLLLL